MFADELTMPDRRHPFVAEVGRAWRRLTSDPRARRAGRGEPCVVACSAGCDSSALAIAMAALTRGVLIAHIQHDLRPEPDARADADAAAELARRLSLPFAHAGVRVADMPGNAEANARRARYAALERIARDRGYRFIATAHHADDQLETMLIRLLRGAGPLGMRGIMETRLLSNAPPGSERLRLVRPMLRLTRLGSQELCRGAGWAWREDLTNTDATRLRASLRYEVIPRIRVISPGAELRAARSAPLFADAARLIEDLAEQALARAALGPAQRDDLAHAPTGTGLAEGEPTGLAFDRAVLAEPSIVVVGQALRLALARVSRVPRRDRHTANTLARLIHAVRDRSTEPRAFDLAGCRVVVTAHRVAMLPVSAPRVPRT